MKSLCVFIVVLLSLSLSLTSAVTTCADKPCQNDGTCINRPDGSFQCDCTYTGYQGDRCQTSYETCFGDPCQNWGYCTTGPDGNFQCECGPAFRGKRCEIPVTTCVDKHAPCQNGGLCRNRPGGTYTCDCTGTGYRGDRCQERVISCAYFPCLHGRCTNRPDGSFKCDCSGTRFVGERCEKCGRCNNSFIG